jgi:hypothetical protein
MLAMNAMATSITTENNLCFIMTTTPECAVPPRRPPSDRSP